MYAELLTVTAMRAADPDAAGLLPGAQLDFSDVSAPAAEMPAETKSCKRCASSMGAALANTSTTASCNPRPPSQHYHAAFLPKLRERFEEALERAGSEVSPPPYFQHDGFVHAPTRRWGGMSNEPTPHLDDARSTQTAALPAAVTAGAAAATGTSGTSAACGRSDRTGSNYSILIAAPDGVPASATLPALDSHRVP